jgi:Xaa-Pro aminopeptidase
MVVSTPHNIAYLSNFDGSTALAVVTAARLYLLSDFRYSAAVTRLFGSAGAPPDAEFVLVDGSYDAALARVVGATGAEVIGFEASQVSVARAGLGREVWAPIVPSVDGGSWDSTACVETLRAVKDGHETAILLESAARLSESRVACCATVVVAAGRRAPLPRHRLPHDDGGVRLAGVRHDRGARREWRLATRASD